MRQITTLLVLLGIILLVYGLYNCSCRKKPIERFQSTPIMTLQPTLQPTSQPNINNQTQQIKSDLSKINSIAENNKYLVQKTNEIKENLQKIQKIMMLQK
jgi:hypothetical protein